MASLFITGTDTNIGKTTVSRALLQLLENHNISIAPYKPIACGNDDDKLIEPNNTNYSFEEHKDILILRSSCKGLLPHQKINSYSFTGFSIPVFSALGKIHCIHIDNLNRDLAHLEHHYKNVIVEGTHGWLTPINAEYTFADWIKLTEMSVLLVVGIQAGCVNKTLLTLNAIKQQNIKLVGWVANRINPGVRYYPELIELLKQKIDAPLLGELPYIGHPEKRELFNYIQNPEPLLQYFSQST
ncbi:dethiobiotin synthase [Pasteurella skyensis]|uniref:ATP-dependent dethiobiotin synthetase BioD n=1 Tax=Phocoenobacter skyensis TaxID=97481 RepID=A0AAJ6N9H5_9PAST|nr:dethiobiotin synthase [Pasteurella skyensis]MDP8162225.1 dethiobiotin synthase [Pasteurella skyensis]MDP8172689.1 dethiobiotin synthase [Pasteurella skyensis]MDP8179189.1 dethiobiotin synthase [Pasteurella skyensis]MDP8183356.1 dethiobiotin synthase [Pasteurella skyensis]MDP8189003.1 dethiobiotin synthase [Pasteurella skyensis]